MDTDRCVPGLCYVVVWRDRETPKLLCNQHAGSAEDLTHPSLLLCWLAFSDRYMEMFKLGFIDVICDATVATVAGRVVPGELVCGMSL